MKSLNFRWERVNCPWSAIFSVLWCYFYFGSSAEPVSKDFLKLIINRPLWPNLRLNFDAQGNLAIDLQIAKFKAINFELRFPKTTHMIERFRIISQNKTSSQIINRPRNICWINLENLLEISLAEFFNIFESSMVGEINWQDSKREFLLWSAH